MDGLDGFAGAPDRFVRQLAPMGIAGRLPGHGAQPEAPAGIEAGAFQATIIEGQVFRLAVFQEKLAVVRALQGVVHQGLGPAPVQLVVAEKQGIGGGDMGHGGSPYQRKAQGFDPS